MKLKRLIERLKKFNQTESEASEDRLNILRKGGAKIGSDVYVYASNATIIDGTAPWLLTIGNHVRITSGVKILTHDYAWSVLKHFSADDVLPGGIYGAQRPVEIGDCVFIGMNAIITCGSKIGDRVIIGAGSVVSGVCESNSVYVGVPARRIMSLDEYCAKRKARQFEEAREFVRLYRERLGKMPTQDIVSEYFMLFCTAEQAQKVPAFREKMAQLDNFEDTMAYMHANPPMFDGYEEFLDACIS